MKKLIIYQNPIAYKSKDGSDITGYNEFVHSYLVNGGDPRKVDKACPELERIGNPVFHTEVKGSDFKPLTLVEVLQRQEDEAKDGSD